MSPRVKGTSKAFLWRWDTLISLLALIVSALALWQGLDAQSRNSAPNVQLYGDTVSWRLETRVTSNFVPATVVYGTVSLKNFGLTPAQITDIRWEPLSFGPFDSTASYMMVSDDPMEYQQFSDSYKTDAFLGFSFEDFTEKYSDNPVAALKNNTIEPGEVKQVFFGYEYLVRDDYQSGVSNVRFVFTLSTGQEISVLPRYGQ